MNYKIKRIISFCTSTGFKDKNDKMIVERDVLNSELYGVCTVIYSNNNQCFMLENDGWNIKHCLTSVVAKHSEIIDHQFFTKSEIEYDNEECI